MSHLQFSDREVERVLAGQQPYGRPELAEVAYLVARLRTLVDFEPAPAISPALRAQLEAAERARLRRAKGRRRGEAASYGSFEPDHALELVRLDARRRERTKGARLRWRMVGAAAAIATIGGVIAVGLQGGGTSPEVETETVVEPAGQTTSTGADATTDSNTAPAASAGDAPARPTDIPSELPSAEVETGNATATEDRSSDVPPPAVDEDPNQAVDNWPPECPQNDPQCVCEYYDLGDEGFCPPDGYSSASADP